LVVLDPVDLDDGVTSTEHGDWLWNKIQESGKWHLLPRLEAEKKLGEFGWDASNSCHEFQCAFDAGSTLLADYVLFGTVTALDGIYAYSFNIIHVPTSQVVASEVGEVRRSPVSPGASGEDSLRAKLAAFASGLDPSRFDKSRTISRGLLAVVDLSVESPESRVLAERVETHVRAARHYDLMSQTELDELLSAMNISLAATEPTDSSMVALGARLKVAYLVQSTLSSGPRGNTMELALFDVSGKHRIRDLSSRPTKDFRDILQLEPRFLASLKARPDGPLVAQDPKATHGPRSVWKRTLFSALGISAATGLGILAYSTRREADGAHARAESAYSAESASEWKSQVEDKDRETLAYGSLAALTLGASITLWAF